MKPVHRTFGVLLAGILIGLLGALLLILRLDRTAVDAVKVVSGPITQDANTIVTPDVPRQEAVAREASSPIPPVLDVRVELDADRLQRDVEVQFSGPATLRVVVVGIENTSRQRINVGIQPAGAGSLLRQEWIDSGVEGRFGRSGRSESVPQTEDSENQSNSRGSVSSVEKAGEPGVFTFASLRPGNYRIAVFELDSELASLPVDLVEGPNEFTISIPELISLTVFVPNGRPGDQILIPYGVNFLSRIQALDERQEATFDSLPAGEFMVSHEFNEGLNALNASIMRIRVSASGTVTYQADPFNSLEVLISSEDGSLAEMGLRDGDVVVAINDQRFEDLMGMGQAYGLAPPSCCSKYSVRRDGQVLDIEMEDEVLRAPRQWGGLLRPALR